MAFHRGAKMAYSITTIVSSIEEYESNQGEREAQEAGTRINMSAEQRRENMPKFSLKEPVEGAEGARTSGLFEKDNIKSLLKERFEDYGKDKENLEIAAEALSNLEPSDDSLWRDPSRVHNIAKGINEQFINKGYVDFRGRKVESPEDVALMMQVCRDPRYETFRLLLVSNGKIVNVTSITSQLRSIVGRKWRIV